MCVFATLHHSGTLRCFALRHTLSRCFQCAVFSIRLTNLRINNFFMNIYIDLENPKP